VTRRLKLKFDQLVEAGPSFLEEPSAGMRQLRTEARDALTASGWPRQPYDPARELGLFVLALHASARTRAELPAELQTAPVPKLSDEAFGEFVAPYLVSPPQDEPLAAQAQAWLCADLIKHEVGYDIVYDLTSNFSWSDKTAVFTHYDKLRRPLGLYLGLGFSLGLQSQTTQPPTLSAEQITKSEDFRSAVQTWPRNLPPSDFLKALPQMIQPQGPAQVASTATAAQIASAVATPAPIGVVTSSASEEESKQGRASPATASVALVEETKEAPPLEETTEGQQAFQQEQGGQEESEEEEGEEQVQDETAAWLLVYDYQEVVAEARKRLMNSEQSATVFDAITNNASIEQLGSRFRPDTLARHLINELVGPRRNATVLEKLSFVDFEARSEEERHPWWPPAELWRLLKLRNTRASKLGKPLPDTGLFLAVYTVTAADVQQVWDLFATGTDTPPVARRDPDVCTEREEEVWRVIGNLVSWFWQSKRMGKNVSPTTVETLTRFLREYGPELSSMALADGGGEPNLFQNLALASSTDDVQRALQLFQTSGRKFIRAGFSSACTLPKNPASLSPGLTIEQELQSEWI